MTEKWIADTGLVSALLFLILGFKYGKEFFVVGAVLLLLLILVPRAFYPLAFVWLKFVWLLNLVIPKIFFGLVFFIIILPIGTIRRLLKGDTLLISNWRDVRTSFTDRNHLFERKDLETTY